MCQNDTERNSYTIVIGLRDSLDHSQACGLVAIVRVLIHSTQGHCSPKCAARMPTSTKSITPFLKKSAQGL